MRGFTMAGLACIALLLTACGPTDRPAPAEPALRSATLPTAARPPTTVTPTTSAPTTSVQTPPGRRSSGLVKDGTVLPGRRVDVRGLEGVVLDPDAFVFAENVDSWFEPTTAEISRAEEALGQALVAAGGSGPQIARSIADYRRQYAGIVRDGREMVAINGFCSAYWPFAPDWERNQVIAFGGGACFWYAELDARTGEPVTIEVTGD